MQFFTVAKTGDVPQGEGRAFEVGDRTIAVFNCDGVYSAIDDQCPHMGASLAAGYLENCTVTCAWHAWRFDVRDGTWCDNPRVSIDSYPTRVVGDEIQVGISEKVPTVRENATTSFPSLSPAKNLSKKREKMSDTKPMHSEVTLGDFQKLIRDMYYEKDVARGVEGTFMWLMQEVGELATSLRERDRENQSEEFADVLAWLVTIANVCQIDLTEAVRKKYGAGCPGCGKLVCVCPNSEKP